MRFWSIYVDLDTRERTRFRKFVFSPYLNPNPVLGKLIDFIEDQVGDEAYGPPTREVMHEHLFPGTAFDYFAISNHISDLQQLLEQYFVLEELKEDSLLQGNTLLRQLRLRRIDKLFLSKLKAQHKKLKKQPYHDSKWYLHRYRMEEERYDFGVAKGDRARRTELSVKLHYQELYVLSSMLISLCEWANRRNVVSTPAEEGSDIQDKLDYIERRRALIHEHIYLDLYYQSLKTLLEPNDESYYQSLKVILLTQTAAFPPKLLTNPFHVAINYCIKKLNQGANQYVIEAFEMYQQAIERKALFHEQVLMDGDLKNIVTLGVRLKAFEWTEAFVEQNYIHLPPKQQASALAFNRAYIHYGKGAYSKALSLLSSADFEDVYYQIGAKSMLLKIYFERMELEPLEALLHAFKQYLNRNKLVSSYQKKININLIRLTQKVMKLWGLEPAERTRRTRAILDELAEVKEVANSDWLREVLQR